MQAKEKISDAARQTSEEGFFNPSTLEQVIYYHILNSLNVLKCFFMVIIGLVYGSSSSSGRRGKE